MKKKIFQVDAFTNVAFGGNPAGVVPDASGLDEIMMQKIANEMQVSETAFVFPCEEEGVDFHVRFFTPTQEVDLCGHATIATFFILAKTGQIKGDNEIKIVKQKTRAGILPVEIEFKDGKINRVMMTQAKPKTIFEVEDIEELAKIMGLKTEDIGIDHYSIKPQAVSTGLPDIMMPVRNLELLTSISPDYEALAEYSRRLDVIGVHAFTLESEEENSTLACRNFAPAAGIDEEAATGTSNGALGAYLIKNDILQLNEVIILICEQGRSMNRDSKIVVKLEGDKADFVVKVGGEAIVILEGNILI